MGNHPSNDEAGMVWLPYRRYELTSKLSPEQIKEKLQEGDSEYTADFLPDYIRLKEQDMFSFGAYSRSFKPQAKLYLTVTTDGTKASVVLKPAAKVILISCLVIILLLASIAFSKRSDLSTGRYKETAVACFGILVFGYLLPVVAFNADLSKFKLFIANLLEVEQD
ncbi:hypothetical protein [Mucilaginibacter panaciglaebae]|uniref:Uncharacterized protein n=1 Tax=Mucilaginibacter panaciglaebae TaxID=502331 RepID=A0ABP7WD42_9SPHI